ncbi:MAG: type III-B CRISPR module-associated protein Cmr5 [Chloroflexi bacterium]|nr:type III-B CRISPR module-associated protein Cmr5 [Chloroflexota bacterium]
MTTQTTDDQQKRTGTRRQTMEQKRARQAWDNIKWIKQESEERKDNDKLQKEYRTRVSQLNTMIQINGLGPTLGFLKSKKAQPKEKDKNSPLPNAYDYLLYHLTQWTSDHFPVPAPGTATSSTVPKGYDGLLTWIIYNATTAQYRRATTECLAFEIWLRRFAEAELQAESTALATPTEVAAKASGPIEAAEASADEPVVPEQTQSTTTSQEGVE